MNIQQLVHCMISVKPAKTVFSGTGASFGGIGHIHIYIYIYIYIYICYVYMCVSVAVAVFLCLSVCLSVSICVTRSFQIIQKSKIHKLRFCLVPV